MANRYISDLHFFHKNVTAMGSNFDNRPFQDIEEMHEGIRKRWNQEVAPKDDVYVLGGPDLESEKRQPGSCKRAAGFPEWEAASDPWES